MTNLFTNFLNLSDSSRAHRVHTLALTVGSPSAHRRGTMLRLCSVVAILLTIGVGNVWGTSARISAYGNITNGTYWVGATVSSTDYYFKANGGIATSDNNLSGTSTTNPMTDGTVVKITISSTAQNSKTGTVQFLNGNHMFLPASAAKYKSQTSSATWTFTTASSKIRMTNNSRVLQKNSGASLNFGSYASGQIDVWLEPARKVKYDGNGNTGGKAPDSTFYLTSATVTVASNSGSLVKTGYTFSGWNTQPDGNGTNYTVGSGTFTMTWEKPSYPVAGV